MDWQELQEAVLGGQGLSNETAAQLLPHLSAAEGDQDVAALEASGALFFLGPEGSAQYNYMAEQARLFYNSTAGQQRGVLVCALASRMGALQDSRRARTGKRPRTDAADAAQGQPDLFFPPKQSPGNATTFHPSPPAAPTMAVRRFSYLGVPSPLREQHDLLDAQARALPRTDPQRKELKKQINQLPGAFRWQVAEFQPVREVEAAQHQISPITAVETRGTLLWLTLQNMPDLVVERSTVQVSGLGQADGHRRVERKDVGEGSIGLAGVAANWTLGDVQHPSGASIRVTHVLDDSLLLCYFRLESAPQPQQPVAVPAAQQAAPQFVLPAIGAPALQQHQELPGFFCKAPQAGVAAGAAGPSGAAAVQPEDFLGEASTDLHVRSLTAGQAQRPQAPEGVALPTNPALVVRNDAVFYRDLICLGDIRGRVMELSDQRFKTQVNALAGALHLISRLQVREFCWADDPTGERVAGFLAQEVKQVLPQAVKVAEDDTHYLAVTQLVPHVVRAVQQLHEEGTAHMDALEDLQERVEQLEALLAPLLCGSFSSLVQQQEYAAAGSTPPPRGKLLGLPAAPGSSSVTGQPTGIKYAVTAKARSMFKGKMPASIAELLAMNLQEENVTIKKKYQSWTVKFGPAIVAKLYLDAKFRDTSTTAQGQKRAPAGEFVRLAKELERDQQQMAHDAEAAASHSDKPLRGYQQEILKLLADGGNFLVVAPTGAGKTMIQAHHSALLLQRKPTAKTVYLAPTVNLADQQAAEFRASQPFNSFQFRVECRCGGKTVAPADWPSLLRSSSVVVLTPAVFQDLLASGSATFEQLDLLILDEVHNATGDAPMAAVLQMYRQWREKRGEGAAALQVLGFTASPASKRTLNATEEAMDRLEDLLLARCIVLDEDHPELRQHVVPAEERRIMVNPREEDRRFAAALGHWVLGALDLLGGHLLGLVAGSDSEEEEGECAGHLPPELSLGSAALQDLAFGLFSPEAEKWCAEAAKLVQASDLAELAFKEDLCCCLGLVNDALSGLSVAANLGFEAAARFLARVVADTVQRLLGVRSEVLLGSPAPADNDSGGWGGGLEGLAMELLLRLSRQVLGCSTLEEAYRDGINGAPKSPKYAAMREVLLSFKEQAGVHGIVFIRTRADALALHSILSADRELSFFQLHLLMGHGAGTTSGMSVKRQRDAREAFAQEGQHLLVATAAAEEGLNIPSCQFVLRFNATHTGAFTSAGRERLQSKGRTRVKGSQYFELVEQGTLEERLAHKSVQEESNLKQALSRRLQAIRI